MTKYMRAQHRLLCFAYDIFQMVLYYNYDLLMLASQLYFSSLSLEPELNNEKSLRMPITSRSIPDDVTNESRDASIVTWKNRYLTR